MKPYLLITVFVLAAIAGHAQQLPSQIQAKRGVFTDRLFLNGQWIDRISTNLLSTDDSSNNVLTTGKAVTDFVRMHSIQHAAVTADGEYTHNWNHKGLRIDSINRLQFDIFETDSNMPDNQKVHNTIQMNHGGQYDSAINLISVLRNINNNADSIISQLRVSPVGPILTYQDDKVLLNAGPSEGSIDFGAYDYADNFSEMFVAPGGIELNNVKGNFYIHGLASTIDTGAYKPIVYNANTDKIAWLNAWPGSGGTAKDTNYLPVFTGLDNVKTVSGYITGATRIGNTVQVSGFITVTADSASHTNTFVEISVPWNSAVWGPGIVSGTAFNSDYQVSAQITGSFDSKALFKFASVTTDPVNFSFSFQYRVITLMVIPIDPTPPLYPTDPIP